MNGIRPKVLDKIYESPEDTIHHLNLVYVDPSKLTISRQGKKGKFDYVYNGKTLSDERQIERIKSLVIPPAWQKVKITHLDNGHLQAIGRDDKSRKQYRYHATWSKIRNQTKFYRLKEFAKHLPKIRVAVEEGLALDKWSQQKAVALVVKLMDETHIRIGNASYAKRNDTYGLVTLRKKHVVDDDSKLRFEFVGKRGKEHRVTIKNKRLIRLVRQCEEIPGWELFQFYDPDGNKKSLNSTMVNEFLLEVTNEHFTAKDFRTWSATVIFYETLRQLEEKEVEEDKKVLMAFDAAAAALGNTRKVCRKYYVHPEIENQFRKDFPRVKKLKNKDTNGSDGLSQSEQEVLFMVKNYLPKI